MTELIYRPDKAGAGGAQACSSPGLGHKVFRVSQSPQPSRPALHLIRIASPEGRHHRRPVGEEVHGWSWTRAGSFPADDKGHS